MIVFIYYWRFERGMIKKLFLISRSKLHVRIGVDQNYLKKGYGWMCKSCRRVENKSEIGIDRFWKGRERRRRMYRCLVPPTRGLFTPLTRLVPLPRHQKPVLALRISRP